MYPQGVYADVLAGALKLRTAKKSLTLTANNETLSQDVFTITGAIILYGLWGEVTTAIGSNHTAAHYRIDDQTAQTAITAAAGVTLSSLAAGTMIIKTGLAATALTLLNNAVGAFNEGSAQGGKPMTPIILVKKTAATTDIEYRYSTTNAPTTGVIEHTALWMPLSEDGNLVAA